jgi:hypothetical protein
MSRRSFGGVHSGSITTALQGGERVQLKSTSKSLLRPRALWLAARVALLAGLAAFYLLGATEHARVVNTSKARGDQSGYLWDAEQIYANWHGQNPPVLVGERNRMPLYAAYQALFYDSRLSDPEFFEVAKTWNIRLSLVLLALLCVVFSWHLPPIISTNLTLIVAFGYFVFKAGYAQAELLFYFLFFLTFLALCHLLRHRGSGSGLLLGILAGSLAALAQLTKAAMLPLVAIYLAVYVVREAVLLVRDWRREEASARPRALVQFAWRAGAGALVVICFVGVLYPYVSTSKRVFGQYFYNVNTTFYVWYDDWPQASVGTIKHGDAVGWPTLPPEQLPGMRKYWKGHTFKQILDRLRGGFEDIVVRSYRTYWYLKYVALYAAFALAVIATNWRAFARLVRERAAIFLFMSLYGAAYLCAVAFYSPVSGTGTTRFLLAHVAPLMFVLSCFLARPPFRLTQWTVGGVTVTLAHFHLLVLVTIGLDLTFALWPRLMTTYGGF